jgi:hypothetical protein
MVMNADEWFWLVRQSPGMDNVTLLGLVVDDLGTGSIVFEGIDRMTGLRHRISWLVKLEDKMLKSVVATVAFIPKE